MHNNEKLLTILTWITKIWRGRLAQGVAIQQGIFFHIENPQEDYFKHIKALIMWCRWRRILELRWFEHISRFIR